MLLLVAISAAGAGEATSRPPFLDLKAPILWGAECPEPQDGGLAAAAETVRLKTEAVPLVTALVTDLDTLIAELGALKLEAYETGQAKRALALLQPARGTARTSWARPIP